MLSTKLKEAAGNSADATLYVDDVFSTYLYTGNGSTQTITNGIDLAGKGGLVWLKDRTQANPNGLFDTNRGVYKLLISNTTDAQQNVVVDLTAFNSNGFSIGSDSWFNSSSSNYVSWTFRKAAKFFDVVTYTGTGSARTIAHSLGVAPGMVIVKRTDTTGNWQVYSNGLTSAAYSIQLNLTAAQASAPTVWNSTAPTSSVFSVGTDATVNASGGTYVAYLYAHDTSSTGIIQCGSFTTDGSGNATVNLGWEPQYVMVKRVNGAGSWRILDTLRGYGLATDSPILDANEAYQESFAGSNTGYPTATGFTQRSYYPSEPIIYMAIRMPNKPPTTGTQVYMPIARTGTGAVGASTSFGQVTDLVFTKQRSSTETWAFTDRLRGATKEITSPTGNTEEITYVNDVTGFDTMTGFKFGSGVSGQINTSATTYVDNLFRRAPGFFDVVCYTGTGSASTQAHNLTVVPELILVDCRSNPRNWPVYAGNKSSYLILSTTAAQITADTVVWNNTAPTLTTFSLGTYSLNNASTYTYVAYLFATLAGISKVGSYTGNGTGQAIACGFSAGARFVLIKRTDSTGDWYTFDSARGLTSGSSPYLLLNSTAAETTGNNGVYASTGGFTLGSTASTTTNINGASYIYLSVA